MNVFEMVAIIVVATSVAGVLRARYKSERSRHEGNSPALVSENRALKDEIRTLKERVAVLERIATEKPDTLSREIEALRDG